MNPRWPDLPFEEWAETRNTPHLRLRVLDQVKLALTRVLDEGRNVALSSAARAATGLVPRVR